MIPQSHIIHFQGSNFNFKAGDTIGIIPHNDESDVNFVLNHLNLTSTADLSYTLSTDTSVKGNKIPVHVPMKSTLRHVLTHCLDLRSVLKKVFYGFISSNSTYYIMFSLENCTFGYIKNIHIYDKEKSTAIKIFEYKSIVFMFI